MKRFIRWYRSWLAVRRLIRGDRSIRQLEIRAKCSRKILQKRQKQLASIQRRLTAIGDSTMEDVEEAVANQQSYEEKIDQIRIERDALRDVLVPTLIGMHKKILAGIDAETAIAVRRQVAATMREE